MRTPLAVAPAQQRRWPGGLFILSLVGAAAVTVLVLQDTSSREAAGQQFERAMRYAAGQRWTEAVAVYRNVLDAEPDHPDAGAGLARALFHSGDAEGALLEYGRLWDRGLVDLEEMDLLGWELVDSHAFDIGERLYREASLRLPENVNAQLNLGYMLHRQDRLEDAIAIYDTAAALAPESLAPHVGLARAYLDLGRDAEAWAHIAMLPLPVGDTTRTVRRDNLVTEQFWISAETMLALRARMCEPWLKPGEDSQSAAINRAMQDAITLYDYVLHSGSLEADVHAHWVAAMDHLGRVDDTVAALRGIVEKRRDAAPAFAAVASALLDRGEFALARAHVHEARRYGIQMPEADMARLKAADAGAA